MGFTIDTDSFLKRLSEIDKKRIYAMEVSARAEAKRMEIRAKSDRRWTDRTGQARRSIKGTSERNGGVITIRLSGHVNYMVYLELIKFRHKGSLAVLFPTLDAMRDEVVRRVMSIKG